jgi:hypothetical protein
MASDGHASMHAPQSVHFPESMTAMSSTEMAPLGQASAQAPQATQLSETMVGIFYHLESKVAVMVFKPNLPSRDT